MRVFQRSSLHIGFAFAINRRNRHEHERKWIGDIEKEQHGLG